MTVDSPLHHAVIIAGAGISGLTALMQLKRKLKLTAVVIYEKGDGIGGTWRTFEPAKEFSTQWPGSDGLQNYYQRVVDKFGVGDQIVFHTVVKEARFSRSTGLWTVKLKNVQTSEERTETCNVLISAVGALSAPADPPFDPSDFDGVVMHSARWDRSVSLKDKDIVILGNGCSAAQIVPAIVDEVKSLTQIARAQHSIVAPNQIPDNALTNGIVRWIPGLFPLFRFGVFCLCESYVGLTDKVKGAKGRAQIKKASDAYIEKTAPEKYWHLLKYDFEFGQKRRIIDFPGYTKTLHNDKINLIIPDTIASAKGRTVMTEKGVQVPADVIVLSTGFKVTDYLFPLKVFNNEGESLVERLKGNGVKTYLTSMVASYPSFFMLMGPNSVTGHSSALFNTECTVDMICALLKPVLSSLASTAIEPPVPAPTVEVTQEAEDEWYARMREEMGKKIWEDDGGISWYVDKASGGKCTTLYPWEQLHFKRETQRIVHDRFVWMSCKKHRA